MIQALGAAEAGLLAGLHAQAFPAPWREAEFACLLASPGMFALAAPEAAPEGFVLARVIADEAEIVTLAVAPVARRNGLGALLVEAASTLALSRGAGRMHLEVAARNAPARALYHKLGFAQSGVRPRYYADGDDAILLSRSLAEGVSA